MFPICPIRLLQLWESEPSLSALVSKINLFFFFLVKKKIRWHDRPTMTWCHAWREIILRPNRKGLNLHFKSKGCRTLLNKCKEHCWSCSPTALLFFVFWEALLHERCWRMSLDWIHSVAHESTWGFTRKQRSQNQYWEQEVFEGGQQDRVVIHANVCARVYISIIRDIVQLTIDY